MISRLRMKVAIYFLYGMTLFQQTSQQQHNLQQDTILFEAHGKSASPPLPLSAFPNLQPSISNHQQKLAQPNMITFINGPSIQPLEPLQSSSVSSTIQQQPALHTITFNNGPPIPHPESLQPFSFSSTIQQQPGLNTLTTNNQQPSVPLPTLSPPIQKPNIEQPSFVVNTSQPTTGGGNTKTSFIVPRAMLS